MYTAIRLRPDPLVAAGGITAAGTDGPPLEFGTTVRIIGRHPHARLAVTAMVDLPNDDAVHGVIGARVAGCSIPATISSVWDMTGRG